METDGLLPCVESPDHATTIATLERLREERVRLTHRIDELLKTRDALDAVIGCSEGHARVSDPSDTSV